MQEIDRGYPSILKVIYEIVKEDAFPLKYRIHPRELILRSMAEWTSIQSALTALEKEGIIINQQSGTIYISLTEQGLEICKSSF